MKDSRMSLLLGTELSGWQGRRLREHSFTKDAAFWTVKLVWSKPNRIYFGAKAFEDTFGIETFDKNRKFSALRRDLWGDPRNSAKLD